MKTTLYLFLVFLLHTITLQAQDTFSIVAADSATREVGSAGGSCVDLFAAGYTDPTFIGDLLPDTGAINTQASYVPANQNNARTRMRAGDTPAQIISWLNTNDVANNPAIRQYGIVGFAAGTTSAAGYSGANCINYKNHITGSINGIYYSIQGNILAGQFILDSMELRFRNAQGDLACRLMAAMQGAKIIGADTRCAGFNTSSLFAFVKVAQPGDSYGSPSLSVGVRTVSNAQIEPIDSLQTLFNLQHNCLSAGINNLHKLNLVKVVPNPSNGKLKFEIVTAAVENSTLEIFSSWGSKVYEIALKNSVQEIDLGNEYKGLFFYQLLNKDHAIIATGRLIIL